MKRHLVAAAAALALLAGCGNHPTAGTVIEQRFVPAHINEWVQMVCGAFGKYGCTVYVPIYHSDPVPDTWSLLLQPKGAERDDAGWIDVSQADYDRHGVGTYYDCLCQR